MNAWNGWLFGFACCAFMAAAPAHADTGSISGTVTDADSGLPIANVQITVLQLFFGLNTVGTATTAANGSYQVDGIPTGSSVYVQADGGDFRIVQEWDHLDCPPVADHCGAGGTGVQVSSGQITGNIDFALHGGGVIEGHITRAGSGAAVAHAGIAPFYFTSADANGFYRLASVAPDQYVIWAGADGLVTTFNDGQQCDPFVDCNGIVAAPFAVVAGATSTVDIALAPGVSLSGHVGVENAPDAPGPDVRLYDESDPQRPYITPNGGVYPPPYGSFTFQGLIARSYSVRFGAPEDSAYASEYFDDVACPSDPCDLTGVTHFDTTPGQTITDIDALVTPRQTITGTVVDAATQLPIAGADVQALVLGHNVYGFFWNLSSATHTDAAGTFLLAGIAAGTELTLRINAPGYLGLQAPGIVCDQTNDYCQSDAGWVTPYSVAADTTLALPDVQLNRGAVVSGRVVNAATGGGLAHAEVAIFVGDADVGNLRSDEDGYWTSAALSPATLKLFASSASASQMYDHVACASLYDCNLALATPVGVAGSDQVKQVDFSIADADALFSSAFDH